MKQPDPAADEALRRWADGEDLCAPFAALLAVSGASISMFGSRGIHSTVCASSSLATALDETQLRLGEGPRWEVERTGRAELRADLARDVDSRWPTFLADAEGLGVRALFSFPIALGGVTIGVVDLYRLSSGPMDGEKTALARSLTRLVAAPAVAQAVRSADREHSPEHPGSPALRREVHQATGMILIQLDVSKDEALVLLRAHAFAQGESLDAVAAEVVARRLDFRELRD